MIYTHDKAEEIVGIILESKDDTDHYPAYEGDAGYYQDKKTGKWVAFDNITCDCWIEEFDSEKEALKWIKQS